MTDEAPSDWREELEGHRRFLEGPPIATMGGDEVPTLVRQDANIHRLYLHEAIPKNKLRTSSKTGAPTEVVERTGTDAGAIKSLLFDIFSVKSPDDDIPL